MPFNGKILLVDDEPHIRKFIGLLLRQIGSPTVIEASNGQEGFEKYKSDTPDLVLLDVNMPVLDGLGTLRAIRAHDPDAVVIMLTSLANRQMVEQAIELGASNYIRKDSPKEEMLAALQGTIDACFEAE